MTPSKDPLTVAIEALTRYDYEHIDGESACIAEDPSGQYVKRDDVLALLTAPRAAADTEREAFQRWYTGITVEGPMHHNMERAWLARAAVASTSAALSDSEIIRRMIAAGFSYGHTLHDYEQHFVGVLSNARAALSQPAKEQEPIGIVEELNYGWNDGKTQVRWLKYDSLKIGDRLFAAPVHQLYWRGSPVETQADLIALIKEEAAKGFDAGVRSVQQEAKPEQVTKLEAAIDYIRTMPHGDNCYVSDHYEGDPGNRCNCGKDTLLDWLESDAPQAEAQQKEEVEPSAELMASLDKVLGLGEMERGKKQAAERVTYNVWQDGMVVASASGPRADALREAHHYAHMYRQDGPVEVREAQSKEGGA